MSYLGKFSLANRSLIALATIAILLFGALVIPSLKEELFPSLDFPAISVITMDQGASPAVVEHDVTTPLEQSIQGISGIQTMTSYSNQGVSIIVVEYDYGTDINQARQTIQEHVSSAQASLPSNVTPQVQSYSVSSLPIIQLAVTASEDNSTLATQIKQVVVPELESINGVAHADVTGVRQQIVKITLDLKKVQAQGLNVSQIEGVLQANNITLPAGEITSNGQTLSVQAGNTLSSLNDLKNLIVGVHIPQQSTSVSGSQQIPGSATSGTSQRFGPGSGSSTRSSSTQQRPTATVTPQVTFKPTPVKLSDVATVEQTLAPSTSITRTNGQPSIGIAVTKTANGNTVAISQAISNKISDLQNKLGHGAKIVAVSDQAPYVRSSVDGLVREGLIGAGFAILVILIFLFSLRSTLVTAISIPLSIVIALIGLWIGNFSLNILTLGGLTIAVGRVVDDSIVVLENIHRHLQENGKDRFTLIFQAVREVAGAVTASTFTTVAVFLPIAFTSGIVGELFKSFSITVTIALLASLFVALTIIPVLAYWFLRSPKQIAAQKQQKEYKGTLLERGYVPVLRWVTKYRAITLLVAFLLFAGSMSLVPRLSTNLFDRSSQNTFTIAQTLPANTSLQQADQAAQKIETVLAGIPGIQTYQVTLGSGGSALSSLSGSSGSNTVNFSVTTDPNADQLALQQQVKDRINALSDVGTVTVGGSSGFSSSDLAINVQASDDQTLRNTTQMVLDVLKQTPNATDVSSSLTDGSPLINVHVDPQKALLHGLTVVQVGQSLREIYTGSTVTKITLNGQQEDVDIQLGTPADSVSGMKNLLIPTSTGNVKLSDIADVTQINGPTQITHLNGTRTATVSATVTSSNVGAVSADVQQRINKLNLPSGATVSLGGVTSSQQQTFHDLGIALLIAILLVYLVMVGTFRSLLQPLILLVSIPFAATGSVLLLLATNTALGAPALIGLLMLIGIVVTNAIVLLDLVRQYREKGLDAREAVIEGGRHRLRPILMTAIATILALLPMALGLSKSSGFIAGPLAIVVIGGLTTSTILTLLLVPTLYVLVEDIRGRSGKKVVGSSKNENDAVKYPVISSHRGDHSNTDSPLSALSK